MADLLVGASLPLRLGCEASGTAAIAYAAICAPQLASEPLGQALFVGLTVATLIHVFGRISGAHFNPAVSLVLMLRRGDRRRELLAYWLAQLAGAMAVILGLGSTLPPAHTSASATPFGPELVFTTALLVLIVSWAREGKLCPFSQPLSGMVIGAGLTVFAALAGLLGSGVLNPALSVALALRQGAGSLPSPLLDQLLAQGLAAGLVLVGLGSPEQDRSFASWLRSRLWSWRSVASGASHGGRGT
ncbi:MULTISPECIES: aquaporin [Aphanothece]|uniref:aquaporin n=1 Tax=Aphanothece TaxID=1121 RepID=UPI0039849E8D